MGAAFGFLFQGAPTAAFLVCNKLTVAVSLVNWRGYGYRGEMVRLRVAQLLRARGETAYALAKGAEITEPRAYRLAAEDGAFDRLEADALNRLCAYFDVQPGELLEYVPDAPATPPLAR